MNSRKKTYRKKRQTKKQTYHRKRTYRKKRQTKKQTYHRKRQTKKQLKKRNQSGGSDTDSELEDILDTAEVAATSKLEDILDIAQGIDIDIDMQPTAPGGGEQPLVQPARHSCGSTAGLGEEPIEGGFTKLCNFMSGKNKNKNKVKSVKPKKTIKKK